MSISTKLFAALSPTPGDIVRAQFRKLYLRLFPEILEDFLHKDDINLALSVITEELVATKELLRWHFHNWDGTPTTPPTIPIPFVAPGTVASSAIGEALVVPTGVPQPVGGEISMQPSRRDPFPIATPPFNPLGLV